VEAQNADSVARAKRRREQVRYFVDHPEVFTQFLVRTLITVAAYAFGLIAFLISLLGLSVVRLLDPERVERLPLPLPDGPIFTILGLAAVAVIIATILHRMFVAAVLYVLVRRHRINAGEWPEDWRL
jgi:amino acid transporter